MVCCAISTTIAFVNLRCDGCDSEAASDWPLNGVTLRFRKLQSIFTSACVSTDWLRYRLIFKSLGALLVEIGDWVGLDAAIFFIDRDHKAAIVLQAERFESLLLTRLIAWDIDAPDFDQAIGRPSHHVVTGRWKFCKLNSSILTDFKLAQVSVALSFVFARNLCKVEFPAEKLASRGTCNDYTCWAASNSVDFFVTSAGAIVIGSQSHIENENFLSRVYTIILIASRLAYLVLLGSGSTTTSARPKLLIVASLLWAGGPLVRTLAVLQAAERREVVKVNSAIIRASQKELVLDKWIYWSEFRRFNSLGRVRGTVLERLNQWLASGSQICLVGGLRGRWDARCDEYEPVDEVLVAGEALDNSAHLQIPDNHLGILASRCDKSITLANVDICDKVKVAMETCL